MVARARAHLQDQHHQHQHHDHDQHHVARARAHLQDQVIEETNLFEGWPPLKKHFQIEMFSRIDMKSFHQ